MLVYLGARWTARLATRGERGASAVEYGLLIVGVGVACMLTLQVLGLTLGGVFRHQDSVNAQCHGMGCSTPAP